MQNIHILSALIEATDLGSFAARFYFLTGVAAYEERESSNYLDGHYFRGSNDDLSFTIGRSDEAGYDAFPYWISIESVSLNSELFAKAVDQVVLESLLPNGFNVIRLVNFGKHDQERVDYVAR